MVIYCYKQAVMVSEVISPDFVMKKQTDQVIEIVSFVLLSEVIT